MISSKLIEKTRKFIIKLLKTKLLRIGLTSKTLLKREWIQVILFEVKFPKPKFIIFKDKIILFKAKKILPKFTITLLKVMIILLKAKVPHLKVKIILFKGKFFKASKSMILTKIVNKQKQIKKLNLIIISLKNLLN